MPRSPKICHNMHNVQALQNMFLDMLVNTQEFQNAEWAHPAKCISGHAFVHAGVDVQALQNSECALAECVLGHASEHPLQNVFLDVLLNMHCRMYFWTCFWTRRSCQTQNPRCQTQNPRAPQNVSVNMLLSLHPPRYIMPSIPSLFLFHQSSFLHISTIIPTTDHALSTIQHHLHFNSIFPPCPFTMHHQWNQHGITTPHHLPWWRYGILLHPCLLCRPIPTQCQLDWMWMSTIWQQYSLHQYHHDFPNYLQYVHHSWCLFV